MDLRDYVRILRKSWALILAVTVVGVALGVGLTLATTKVYEATSQVYVSSSNDAVNTSGGTNASSIVSRVQSYPNLATARPILSATLEDPAVLAELKALGRMKTVDGKSVPDLTIGDFKHKVTADVPSDSVVVNLHVTDTNPTLAYTLATALTTQFTKIVPAQYEQQALVPNSDPAQYNASVQLRVTNFASVPSEPIKPNKIVNIGVGLALGLMIGIGVAITREVLDNTVKGAKDFEELGIPLLAQVAFDKKAARTPIAFRGDAHSARSEAYRQLRTNLQFVDIDNPPRIIAITSAVPGEGKSSTAINLAAALAEAGSKVCLIEADLRRPSIAKSLGLVSDVGFTTAVIGKAPVETVLQNAGRNLAVLTCGPIPPNPSELLLSQHAKQVIFDIADKVDYVIIDTPPLLPVTDGAEISTIADATLLVHRAARTTRDQAARSLQALEKVGRRPVGVILNMVTRGGGGRYDYEYGYYYAAYRPRKDGDDAATPSAADGAVTAPATPATTDPFGTGESLEAVGVEKVEKAASAGSRFARRRDARHRGAAGSENGVAGDSLDTAALPAAEVAPVDTEAADAFAPVDDVVDAEVVPPSDAALTDSAQARPAGDPVAVDDAYDYDDYYDEDQTDTFAPVPDAAPDAGDGAGRHDLGDRINGRADVDGDRLGRRGRRGRR